MKKPFLFLALPLLAIIGTAGIGVNLYGRSARMKTISVDANLLILENGAGNSLVLMSEDGTKALVVDTKYGSGAKQLASLVKGKDVIVVNTHDHFDHTGGNSQFPEATFITGGSAEQQQQSKEKKPQRPGIAIRAGQDTAIQIGSETVHIRNMGRAHTWNDVIVYLENHNILVTGDIVFNRMHPAMFTKAGTNAASWLTVLDTLIGRYPGARVLPGHGDFTDAAALVEMREYFTTIQAAIGNPEMVAAAKQRFKNYHSIPVLTGFKKTVAFIEKERKAN